jgi:aminoglycoside phosphotransferase (APT) family kinase protein
VGKIDRKIARAGANNLPYGTMAECEKQKSLVLDYWIPHLDDAPHVLVHGDLSRNNIIVKDTSNVERYQ